MNNSRNLSSAWLLKKRQWVRVFYYCAVIFTIGFLLVAMIGIYGSLTGFKGPFWRISEICGYIADLKCPQKSPFRALYFNRTVMVETKR